MIAPKPLFQRHFRAFYRNVDRTPRRLGPAALALLGLGGLLPAQLQFDTVTSVDRRGRAQTVRGTVVENTLTETVVDVDGRETKIPSGAVRSVKLGRVLDAFLAGVDFFEAGDLENAAAQFRAAAGDSGTSAVVHAEARLRAARALLARGSQDAGAFGEAVSELERFLADHGDHRDLPAARALLGRAQWLTGDLDAATATFRALHGELSGDEPNTGYSLVGCFDAGLQAARCELANGAASAATQAFADLSSALTSALARLDDDDERRADLARLEVEARLGEGFCMLADGKTTQAKTFFEGQLTAAPKLGPQRCAARYGLGLVYFAEARYREAANEFAQVSALEASNRDRAAGAIVGLARCAAKLADADSDEQIARWVATLRDHYGDTPALLAAPELAGG